MRLHTVRASRPKSNEYIIPIETELNTDVSTDSEFYLNENGDLCFDRVYIDNLPAIDTGEYMYNLTKGKEITEFEVGA